MQFIKFIAIIFILNFIFADCDRLFDDLQKISPRNGTSYNISKYQGDIFFPSFGILPGSHIALSTQLISDKDILLSLNSFPQNNLEIASFFSTNMQYRIYARYTLIKDYNPALAVAYLWENSSPCYFIFTGCKFNNIDATFGFCKKQKTKPFGAISWQYSPYIQLACSYNSQLNLSCNYIWNKTLCSLNINNFSKQLSLSASLSYILDINPFFANRQDTKIDPKNIITYFSSNNFMHIKATTTSAFDLNNHIYQLSKTLTNETKIAIDNGYFIVGQYNVLKSIIDKIDDITAKEFQYLVPLEPYSHVNKTFSKGKTLFKVSGYPTVSTSIKNINIHAVINGFLTNRIHYELNTKYNAYTNSLSLYKFYLTSYINGTYNIFYKMSLGYFSDNITGVASEILYSKPFSGYAFGVRYALLHDNNIHNIYNIAFNNGFALFDSYYFYNSLGFRLTTGYFLNNRFGYKLRSMFYFPNGLGIGTAINWGKKHFMRCNLALCIFIPLDIFFTDSISCINFSFSLSKNSLPNSMQCGGADIYDRLILYHNNIIPY